MGLLGLFLTSLFLLASPAIADQVMLSNFSGLNNNDSSAVIEDNEAQDLLNVDITPNGKSVKKRLGYGMYKTLLSTQPVHGGYHFYNTNGSDVQIWASSSSLFGIVSDGPVTQIVSSATLNATWDCADTQGLAYCVNTSRDALIETNGVSISSWMATPLGTMVEVTPDRLVVAGVASAKNSIYFSGSNNFRNFTNGINDTDPFTEVIAAPGAAITHIRWGCQKLLWWKNSSFGYITGSNQFDLSVVTVNDTVGTIDNSSSIDPGGTVWFRGQDGHIYSYNCSALAKESIDITPLINNSSSKIQNSWSQSTQAEFQTGVSSPTGRLSFTISPGDVVPSTTTLYETTTSFNGSYSRLEGTGNGMQLQRFFTDQFSGFGNWATISTPCSKTWSVSDNRATCNSDGSCCQAYSTLSTYDGAFALEFVAETDSLSSVIGVGIGNSTNNNGYCVIINRTAATMKVTRESNIVTNQCNGTQIYSGGYAPGKSTTTLVRDGAGNFNLYENGSLSGSFNDTTYTTKFDQLYLYDIKPAGKKSYISEVRVTTSSGVYTSPVFNTTFGTATYNVFTATITGTDGDISFGMRFSPNGTTWSAESVVSTGTQIPAVVGNQYSYYTSTITAHHILTAPVLNTVRLIAASTGTYLSPVKNIPNITSWDTLWVDGANDGGTHTYYTRSSNTPFTQIAETPAWVPQKAGGVILCSTNTYFQFRDDFGLTTATQTPKLSNFTAYWYEGAASDKAYSLFFDNAIWWSVAYGAGQSTNNRIFRYDLINKLWTQYDIGTGGMLQQNNYLYFGSTTTTGKIYKFGSGNSDDGVPITAYWKSKDFMGSDPWKENQYDILDSYYRANANQNLTVSYYLDTSTTTTSYTVNLSSDTHSVIRNKKRLPSGKIGGNFSVKFGDVSGSSSWELLGLRIQFTPLPYRPTQ